MTLRGARWIAALSALVIPGALQAATVGDMLGKPWNVLTKEVSFLREPSDIQARSGGARLEVWRLRRVCVLGRSVEATFVFRDGRLERVLQARSQVIRAAPGSDYWKAPREPYFAPRPGELPFQDAFLSGLKRSAGPPLAADTPIADCRASQGHGQGSGRARVEERRADRREPFSLANPSDQQASALAPFAALTPWLNSQRRRAAQRGLAAWRAVSLGAPPPGGREAFARRRGVHVYGSGDYEVFSIDMGAAPSRNLARMNEAAFVGVRHGRVEWKALASSRVGSDLCLDRRGVPGPSRKGCSSTGHFTP